MTTTELPSSPLRPSRRRWLRDAGLGIGGLALTSLLHDEGLFAREGTRFDLRPKTSHVRRRAKSVILLMQNGAPSQMDLFDPKPELNRREGQVHSEKVETFQKGSEQNTLLATPFRFRKYGQCGMDFAEPLPHMASLADQWCMVRSMHTDHNNHTEAMVIFTSGKFLPGRPTFGAWITYALGTENQNLPAYVVLRDPNAYSTNGTQLWHNGWLPALYRGTEFRSVGAPVLNLQSAVAQPQGVQKDNLRLLAELNRRYVSRHPDNLELEARIVNYEVAARMQLAAGDVLDVSRESQSTHTLYGLDNEMTAGYGMRCLLARRLIESGVRFVQIHPPAKPANQPWDSHKNSREQIEKIAPRVDQPSAGLVEDLRQRGLLDETIVIWAGEFGRLPVSQHSKGRDHNRNAFTILLSGGGFKAGFTYGATDELGYRSVENRVSIADFHATLLHQLGIDHRELAYQHLGRDERLTDPAVTSAQVVNELLRHAVSIEKTPAPRSVKS